MISFAEIKNKEAVKGSAVGIMALLLAVCLIFSCLYVVNAQHDCPHEDCPICAFAESRSRLADGIASASTTTFNSIAFLRVALAVCWATLFIRVSPIKLKTRLNN